MRDDCKAHWGEYAGSIENAIRTVDRSGGQRFNLRALPDHALSAHDAKVSEKMEFHAAKPIRKAWQQSSTRVQKWLQEEYPAIAKSAKARGATIYWVDETGVTNKCNSQRGYAPKGKTPILKHDGTKRKVNMISAVTNKGEVRFMCYTSTMTQSKFILFLSKLIKSTDGPVVVITDNLSVHHGKRVAK